MESVSVVDAGLLEEVSSKHRNFRQAGKRRGALLREEVVRKKPREGGQSGGDEQPHPAGSQEALWKLHSHI